MKKYLWYHFLLKLPKFPHVLDKQFGGNSIYPARSIPFYHLLLWYSNPVQILRVIICYSNFWLVLFFQDYFLVIFTFRHNECFMCDKFSYYIYSSEQLRTCVSHIGINEKVVSIFAN